MDFADVVFLYQKAFKNVFCKKMLFRSIPWTIAISFLFSMTMYCTRTMGSFQSLVALLIPVAFSLSFLSYLGTEHSLASCSGLVGIKGRKLSRHHLFLSQLPLISFLLLLSATAAVCAFVCLLSYIPHIRIITGLFSSLLLSLLVIFLWACLWAALFSLFVLPPYFAMAKKTSFASFFIYLGQIKKNLLAYLSLSLLATMPCLLAIAMISLSASIASSLVNSTMLYHHLCTSLLNGISIAPFMLFFFQLAQHSYLRFGMHRHEGI